ncbi:hypothetical protein AAU61_18850 [Desulfocarbo indianensis]|nr:hypothetical protein AAU61_18850 [Desulfocarbo indianensis]
MGKVVIVYKGLTGEAERSPDDNQYYGMIVNIPHEVSFGGSTISELQLSFTRAVDSYLGDPGPEAFSVKANGVGDCGVETPPAMA